jgi:radical SAM protein with 4Fe4S-binding SPASM domain
MVRYIWTYLQEFFVEDLIPFSRLKEQNHPPLSPRIPLIAPLALLIEFTNKCNFACKFCPESFPDYEEQAGGIHWLDFDKFKKICADIIEMGGLKVLRYYKMGETLLNKDAVKMFRYAADMKVAERTELTTNATAITARKAIELVNSGLDYIRISIYGIEPIRHERLTGSKISPAQIQQNIRTLYEVRERLGQKKPYIYVKMLDPFDPVEEAAFRNAYTKIADEVHLEQPHEWNGLDEGKILNGVYSDKGDEARDRIKIGKRDVCPLPFYQPAIHADGNVTMCHVDWSSKTTVGNIFTESLKDIWQGERIYEFQKMHIERRRHENDACRNCTYFYGQPDNIDDLTDASILTRPAEL